MTALSRRLPLLAAALAVTLLPARPVLALAGDVDGNGVVDDRDAQLVLQSVVGTRTLTPAERAAADMDGDGDVDVADAQLIRQAVAARGGK